MDFLSIPQKLFQYALRSLVSSCEIQWIEVILHSTTYLRKSNRLPKLQYSVSSIISLLKRVQCPSMPTMFGCFSTDFITSISRRNARTSSAVGWSVYMKWVIVKIKQRKKKQGILPGICYSNTMFFIIIFAMESFVSNIHPLRKTLCVCLRASVCKSDCLNIILTF